MGYITKGKFDRQASKVSEVEIEGLPNPCLREKSFLELPVDALTPVEGLYQRAGAWEEK